MKDSEYCDNVDVVPVLHQKLNNSNNSNYFQPSASVPAIIILQPPASAPTTPVNTEFKMKVSEYCWNYNDGGKKNSGTSYYSCYNGKQQRKATFLHLHQPAQAPLTSSQIRNAHQHQKPAQNGWPTDDKLQLQLPSLVKNADVTSVPVQEDKWNAEDIRLIKATHHKVVRFIHFGPFTRIYLVKDTTGKLCIAKTESKDEQKKTLGIEALVYKECGQVDGFPMIYNCVEMDGSRAIIMQYLGTDLTRIRDVMPNKRFFPLDASKLALKTFCRIWTLHKNGWLHRDIKPSNFVIGIPPDDKIYILDLGLARRISEHERPNGHCPMLGTTSYQPIAVHNRMEYHAKDDLESWFYMCCEMFTGTFPWLNVPKERVVDWKVFCRHSGRYLLMSQLPVQFDTILDAIDGCTGNCVNYFRILGLLKSVCADFGVKICEPYPWIRDPSILQRALDIVYTGAEI